MVRFQFARHPSGRHHSSGRILAVAIAFAVSAIGPEAIAQTGYSLRIRTLGTPFAGIIDDPFTDAYLNPARVGDLGGRQVYVGQLPGSNVAFLFPGRASVWDLRRVFPPERLPGTGPGWGYAPYTAGFVSPVGRTLTSSFALEAAAEGSERLDDGSTLWVDVNPPMDASSTRDVGGSESSRYHALLDGAVGTGFPETSGGRFGVRATVSYDEYNSADADDRLTIETPDAFGNEQKSSDRYSGSGMHCEQTRLLVALGRFSREGFVRDIVGGGSVEWQRYEQNAVIMDIEDEDYDRNGLDPGGGAPDYSYDRADFDSDREYAGGTLFARLGFQWSRGLRSYHELSWRRLNGDGESQYGRDVIEFDYTPSTLGEECRFGKDGDVTAILCFNGIGYFDEVREGLLWAVAAQVRYYRDTYDETGAGTIVLGIQDSSDTTSIDAPYRQALDYERESWVFHLPVALDWQIHRHFAWRFGVAFQAQRSEVDARTQQSIDVTDVGLSPFSSTGDSRRDLSYQTDVLFSTGFIVNLWDRIDVEFFGGNESGRIDFTSYASALVTYRF